MSRVTNNRHKRITDQIDEELKLRFDFYRLMEKYGYMFTPAEKETCEQIYRSTGDALAAKAEFQIALDRQRIDTLELN